MTEKIFETPCGQLHYWVNDIRADRQSLVFLPGLTADHRLFDRQAAHFQHSRCSTNESRQDLGRQVRELKQAGAERSSWSMNMGMPR